jgi:hypothetical protein
MSNDPVLGEFADQFPFCAVCWNRASLHIHHLVGGPGRRHDRRNLLRLCMWCHEGLHSGGQNDITKGMCLSAKREVDDEHYDPTFLASLRMRRHLGYGPEGYTDRVLWFRRRNGIPSELVDMAINSRRKGKVGELEAAAELNRVLPGAHARRSQQHSGTESASDLIAPGLSGLWLEVKRVQSLNIQKVMEKSLEQCGSLAPVLLHRKNGSDWLVTCRLDDLARVATEVLRAG